MAEYLTTDTELTSIANAIRTRGGTSAALTYPEGFITAIENIPAGSGSPVIITDTIDEHGGTIRHISTTGDTLEGKTADDVILSGATLTVPAGIYALDSTKTFADATATVSGTNTVTPTATISGSGCTLSNTDNGISITATGGGSASASATATTGTAGYAQTNATLGTGTIAASSTTTTATTYISGVTVTAPSSGTRTFSITVPNGAGTATFVFNVDASGNVTITES